MNTIRVSLFTSMKKGLLLLVVVFFVCTESFATNKNQAPDALKAVYENLRGTVSGKYKISYKRKLFFSTDTVKLNGEVYFSQNTDSSFQQYWFELYGKESLLKIDTAYYNAQAESHQYYMSGKIPNYQYSQCFRSFIYYKSLLDYCTDSTVSLSLCKNKKGGFSTVHITSPARNNIAMDIFYDIDMSKHTIRKMIFQFAMANESQYEEIIISEIELYRKSDNPITPSFFLSEKTTIENNYRLVEKNSGQKKEPLLDSLSYAPDLKLLSVSGDSVQLSKIPNTKLIILDFWYVSCYPCLKTTPVLNDIQNTYKDKGVKVIGIDCYDSLSRVKTYAQKHGVNYDMLIGNKQIPKMYHVGAFPTMYILDQNLKVIRVVEGYSVNLKEILDAIILENLR